MDEANETKEIQRDPVFSRVLVGVDGSKERRMAGRQAAALVDGELPLPAAYDVAPAIVRGTDFYVPAAS